MKYEKRFKAYKFFVFSFVPSQAVLFVLLYIVVTICLLIG